MTIAPVLQSGWTTRVRKMRLDLRSEETSDSEVAEERARFTVGSMQNANLRWRVAHVTDIGVSLRVQKSQPKAGTKERDAHQGEWTGRTEQAIRNHLKHRAKDENLHPVSASTVGYVGRDRTLPKPSWSDSRTFATAPMIKPYHEVSVNSGGNEAREGLTQVFATNSIDTIAKPICTLQGQPESPLTRESNTYSVVLLDPRKKGPRRAVVPAAQEEAPAQRGIVHRAASVVRAALAVGDNCSSA